MRILPRRLATSIGHQRLIHGASAARDIAVIGSAMRGNGLRLLVVLGALLAPLLLQPTPALALAFTVNSTIDEPDAIPGDGVCLSTPSGVCTLRAAVMEANFLGGSHSITLPCNYVLTSGHIDITTSIAITGDESTSTAIDGTTPPSRHVKVTVSFENTRKHSPAPQWPDSTQWTSRGR